MNRFPYLVRRFARFVALALAIAFFVSLTPVFAQDNPSAHILLDGNRLFEVSQSGRYNAQKRAEDANLLPLLSSLCQATWGSNCATSKK